MNTKHALARLKWMDLGGEISLGLNPDHFTVSRQFHYDVHPILGARHPLTAFRGSDPEILQVTLPFDKDVHSDDLLAQVKKFLAQADRIHEDSKSVSRLEFRMGEFSFLGFLQKWVLIPTRFDASGKMAQANVSLEIISYGENKEGLA